MKKSGILLLAALSLTLTSCGTQYVAKNDENTTLQLMGSSFTLSENIEEETINLLITRYTYSKFVSYKGKAVASEEKENTYTLTVTNVTAQYQVDGDYADKVLEAVLPSYWSNEEVEKLVAGEKVSKKLLEKDYFNINVTVDEENKYFAYTF